MNVEERLELYQGMVLCCHKLYLWTYDHELKLLHSNCPEEALIDALFSIGTIRDVPLSYAKSERMPLIMSNDLGNMWIAVPEKNGETLVRLHILGPFFVDAVSTEDLERGLQRLRLSPPVLRQTTAFLHSLPVVSLSRAFEYAIMLYYCVTGERISISDLNYLETERREAKVPEQEQTKDVHGTYEMEREMVRMVREGDLNYRKQMDRLALSGTVGKLSNGEPSRQMKNAVLVCAVLFSRAAIEGGLPPEIALTLTDRYFQGVEACRSFSELNELASSMQEDFVRRVHRLRASSLSKIILACCDYINLNLDEEFTLHELAERFKYSECYLSRKFKSELGMNFKNYVRQQRLERAKDLLLDPSVSIRDVSEQLHFCTPSYFAETFRAAYGLSPTEWREVM